MIVIEILLWIAAAWMLHVHVRVVMKMRAFGRSPMLDDAMPPTSLRAIHADLVCVAFILALGFLGLLMK